MTRLVVALAGGGTGGHLYPGLAVADALRAAVPGIEITFFTTQRPLDRDLLSRTAYAQVPQPVHPFTLHPLRVPGFLWRWHQSVRTAARWIRQHRPAAVLGLGGYAAGPPVVAARKLGVRTAILNPDAVPGRANRHLATRVDLVAMQWEASRAYFPAGAPCEVLGCPIRPAFSRPDPAAGRKRFGLAPDRPLLLVTGASQGARTVNQVMTHVWPEFQKIHPEWQILHLTGAADLAGVRAAYAQAGADAQVCDFIHEMADVLAAADVVIARAGASTLAEITALGKPAILLPYPYHRDQHQFANARVLVEAGAALVQQDRLEPQLNAGPLRAALDRLADPDVRAVMGAAAARLGRPTAAGDIASGLLKGAC